MKIGIDASRVTEAGQTGTERYSREIIAAMLRVAPEHEYRLYTRSEENARAVAAFAPANAITRVAPPRLWTHLGLARELARNPPDALFVPAHVLPVSAAWGLRRVRKVVMIHDVGFHIFPAAHPIKQRLYLEFAARFAVKYADVVLALSENTRQDLISQYAAPPAKVQTALPGLPALANVTLAEMDAALNKFGIRGPYALFTGTQQPRKNVRRLLQAWALADGLPDGAQLIIAGKPGWGGEALADIAPPNVKFVGYVSEAEKSALVRRARAVVVPSLYEGFGFPVIEAQSVGAPVACSNTSSLPEAAGDGAVLFDPLDAQDMASAITRVFCDDALRGDLVARGLRNAARFSWEKSAGVVLGAFINSKQEK
jgi:glycosyltransferase involved in cell wall biosynthesis